jgi:site-specific recombinase XerD
MKKVWIYKRKRTKGWWVGWYESGKRKTKALPNKALAEHFRQIKYTQLNSDVFTGTVTVDWNQMRNEYEHSKKVAGYVEASIYEVALTLRHFERLVGKCNSKQITQNAIDKYILERGKEVIRSTVNKDIRNLRAFVRWCRKNRYVNGEIEVRKSMGSRPVPVPIMAELKKYVSGLDTKQENIFTDNFSRYRWTQIRQKLGLDDFTFHDLRKTFGSVLAQNGVSTVVIQKLLEHSSPDLTNKVYTNVDPVLRHAVDQIPAGDWL